MKGSFVKEGYPSLMTIAKKATLLLKPWKQKVSTRKRLIAKFLKTSIFSQISVSSFLVSS